MNKTNFAQQFTEKDIKILKVEVTHEGFCHIEKITLQHSLFNGGWSEPFVRELMNKRCAAAVLPYDPVLDKVVLIEQFRVGALEYNNGSPWLFEVVAGLKDKGEDESFEDLAKREVMEETGMNVLDLMPITHYLVSPGGTSEHVQLFCAHIDANTAPSFSGLSEENEDIRIHVVSSREAFTAVKGGLINNAAAIIALQWLELKLNCPND